MTTTTETKPADVRKAMAYFNEAVNEYAAAVASGDRARHQRAAATMDSLARQFAWNETIIDHLSDFVDAAPVTLQVTHEGEGARASQRPDGYTIYVEHTEHVRGGRHENARDALVAWVEERAS